MAQHDQQPEEAATRPAAAVAQFAGNFTQTSMYGRALANRGTAGQQQPVDPVTGRPTNQPEQKPSTVAGETQPTEPNIASTLNLADDPALRRLIGRFDPDEAWALEGEAQLRAAQEPSGEPWGPGPVTSREVVQPGSWTFAAAEPAADTPATTDVSPLELGAEGPDTPLLGEDDPYLAAADLDAAAAQARLQVGQVEPPPSGPPTPGPIIGAGLV